MKLFTLLSLLVVLGLCSYASASTGSLQFSGDPDAGAIYPFALNIISGETDGAQFVSAVTTINESVVSDTALEVIKLGSEVFTWSYNRGMGSLPGACPAGYTVGQGGCWQDCPAGYSDMGAYCTNWSTLQSTDKEVLAPSCPDGQVNEGGLCYEPCVDGFTSAGALCIGKFDNDATRELISTRAEELQEAALASTSSGGIVIAEEDAPDIRTTVLFSSAMCALESVTDTFGNIPNPVELLEDTINEEISSALEEANTSFTIDTGTTWFAPSIDSTVLFDLSIDITCEDDGTLATAALDVDPSITVQLDTRLFDSALSNLSGVDLGILNISIYELIPFRVYGTVGATVSTPLQLFSELDRTLPALYIDDMQYATDTRIAVTPAVDLWLSVGANLRVSSLVSFIPDIVQLGAEFYLTVLDEKLAYVKSGGLRLSGNGGYEIYNAESLTSEFSSGSGYIDAYLRILGVDVEAFGDDADLSWEGYEQYDVFIDDESATPVAL